MFEKFCRAFIVLLVLISASASCSRQHPSGAGAPGFVRMLIPPYASDRFIVDLRYNTDDNFLHRNVYGEFGVTACELHPIAADRLMNLAPMLQREKLKLVLWDCWRPAAVQKEMWKIMPDARYVADPAKGSNHNRGLAIDCSLAGEDGKLLPMPTPFDDFTERASPGAACQAADAQLCANRDKLVSLIREAGFDVFPTEWWHYQPSGVDVASYPVR